MPVSKSLKHFSTLAFASAVSFSAFAGGYGPPPPFEEREGFYASLHAGLVYTNDFSTHIYGHPVYGGFFEQIDIEFKHDDPGYHVGGALGYQLDKFRIEVEGYFLDTEIDEVRVEGIIHVPPNIVSQSVNGHLSDETGVTVTGDSEMYGVFINALMEFGEFYEMFVPYVGVGIGYSHVKSSVTFYDTSTHYFGTGNAVQFRNTDNEFAYQLIAGLNFEMTDKVDVGVDYRYIGASSTDIYGLFSDHMSNHTVNAVLTARFS